MNRLIVVALLMPLLLGVTQGRGERPRGKASEDKLFGKPVGGLAARLELLEQGKTGVLRFHLKNVSDKPVTVFDWVGGRSLKVDWTGPDGKKRDVDLSKWLESVRLETPHKDNYKKFFIPLAPGKERTISPGGTGDDTIHLKTVPLGKNRVRVSYSNDTTGREFGLKGVWTGTVTSAEVRLEGGKQQVQVIKRGKPAADVVVDMEGKCQAIAGNAVLFVLSFNPTAGPSNWIHRLEVSIDGKSVARPDTYEWGKGGKTPGDSTAYRGFLYRPARAGTSRIQITPINDREGKGKPRNYTLTAREAKRQTPVKTIKEWRGKFEDDKDLPLRKKAPASGYIASNKEWAKLWKAWRGSEKVPPIDFGKELVLVGTIECARNRLRANFHLDSKGDLGGGFSSTEIAGPGFAYLIVVIKRDGVKTIKGKPLVTD